MIGLLRRLMQDRSGATALEYGLIAALICLIALVGLTLLGGQVEVMWNTLSAAFSAAIGG